MHSLFSSAALAALLLLSPVSAQTWTTCDPTKRKCPADPGMNRKHMELDFVKNYKGAMSHFQTTAGTVQHSKKGAAFTIHKRGDSPTIQSKFNIFFGKVEVEMLAAHGQGVISSFVLESADLDEIDWEWVGSDHVNAQSNFFGKGNTTTYDRGAYHKVKGAGPQVMKHRYGIEWTSKALKYLINGRVVRTVPYHDPLALHGRNYPQTPMTIRMGIWAGGDPANSPGTIQWAGGPINYGAGPYTMHVQKVKITNNNPAAAYAYSNKSGSFKSIRKLKSLPKEHRTFAKDRTHAPQVQRDEHALE